MATRKYVNNRVEVIDSQGQTFITPRVVFGYSKVDNFAQVYNLDGHTLTPTGNEKTTGFVSGDRALFFVSVAESSDLAIKYDFGGVQYVVLNKDGSTLKSIDRGWHAMYFDGTNFVLDDFDLDEKDYVYCDNLINGCIAVAENYMTYDIVPKVYREFRNDLGGDYIETDRLYDIDGVIFNLRRGVVAEDLQITYTNRDGETIVVPDSEWYLAGNKLVVTGTYYPTADKLECVAIRYTVSNEIGPDLYSALLQHISEAYEGRGLCTSTTCPAALGIGNGVMAIYNNYRVPRIGA